MFSNGISIGISQYTNREIWKYVECSNGISIGINHNTNGISIGISQYKTIEIHS